MTRSEVVRHRSRLLEEAEHRKLLEKWIFEGLSDEERDGSPPALLDRARTHFRKLADAALREARRRCPPGQDAPFPAAGASRGRRGSRGRPLRGKPVARLVAFESRGERRPDVFKGRVVIPDSFLDPLPEEELSIMAKETFSVPHVGSAQVVWASNLLPPAGGRPGPDSKEGILARARAFAQRVCAILHWRVDDHTGFG